MNTLITFCKKLYLGRVIAVFAAGCLLLLNVACSSGNATGARPNNPPVQMGGQNNPHKGAGDGYSEYQMSTDPAVKKRDRASNLSFSQLIATADQMGERSPNLNKRDLGSTSSRAKSTTKDSMKAAQQVPEPSQDVIDRSDPDVKILEKVGTTFKEAGKHLTGATEQSIEKSGVTQAD